MDVGHPGPACVAQKHGQWAKLGCVLPWQQWLSSAQRAVRRQVRAVRRASAPAGTRAAWAGLCPCRDTQQSWAGLFPCGDTEQPGPHKHLTCTAQPSSSSPRMGVTPPSQGHLPWPDYVGWQPQAYSAPRSAGLASVKEATRLWALEDSRAGTQGCQYTQPQEASRKPHHRCSKSDVCDGGAGNATPQSWACSARVPPFLPAALTRACTRPQLGFTYSLGWVCTGAQGGDIHKLECWVGAEGRRLAS